MQTSLCRFKLRRGKEEDRMKITPEEGEPIFSTDVGRLAVGNGNTPGGVPVNKVWTDSVSAETYAVIGDIKYENNKQYIYKGNNEWVQFGGDGLVAANAPLSVITNNTVVLNLSSYEGNNNKIDLAVNNGKLIVNAGTLVNEVSTIQNNITNINSNISELSANRIYNSISPVVLGYSALYTDKSGEVPSSKLPYSTTSFSGTTNDGNPYKIDRGVKLLYNNETFTTTLKNVTFYEYNNTGSLVQVTSSLPHLDVNLANIEQKATTAATNAAISNVGGTVDSKINTAVNKINTDVDKINTAVSTLESKINDSGVRESKIEWYGNNGEFKWWVIYLDGRVEQGGYTYITNDFSDTDTAQKVDYGIALAATFNIQITGTQTPSIHYRGCPVSISHYDTSGFKFFMGYGTNTSVGVETQGGYIFWYSYGVLSSYFNK